MHASVFEYVREMLKESDIAGKRVLEVGSLNVNGSLREYICSFGPHLYIGIDQVDGPGVSFVYDAGELDRLFHSLAFDLVLCTEMLDHAQHWRSVVRGMKYVLAREGILLVTVRSEGFALHHVPDY